VPVNQSAAPRSLTLLRRPLISPLRPGAAVLALMFIGAALAGTQAWAAGARLYDIEYAIISAALNHGIGGDVQRIVIDGRTTGLVVNISPPDTTREELAKELGTTAYALEEWARVNRDRHTLQTGLATTTPYILLDPAQRDELFNDEDPRINWTRFGAAFPDANGIVRVSRPGIDDGAGVALLYLEFQCGYECGSGRLINLALDATESWQVTSGSLVWITSPEDTE
jgi:hypothetical protein